MPNSLKALLTVIERAMPLWAFWLLAGVTLVSCVLALILTVRLLLRRRTPTARSRQPVAALQPDALPQAPGGMLRCYQLDGVEALANCGISQLLVSPCGLFAVVGVAVGGRLNGQARGERWSLSRRGQHRQTIPNPLLLCRSRLPLLAETCGVALDKLHPCVLVAASARWSSHSDQPVGVYFSAAELIADVRTRLNVVFTDDERRELLARLDALLQPATLTEPQVEEAKPARGRLLQRLRRTPPPVQAG